MPRITSELPQLLWHGEEPLRNLSCAENGPVLGEVSRILVNRQTIQTCVVNSVIYLTGVADNVVNDTGVATLTTRTPDRLDAVMVGLAWCVGLYD